MLSKSIEWLGKNSVYVYLSHITVVWYLEEIILRYIEDESQVLNYLLLVILCIVVVPINALLFKYLCNVIYNPLVRRLKS